MCECIAQINADLAKRGLNTRIETPLFGPKKAMICTVKADDKKREKPAILFASHCPICGEKYSAEGEA